MINNLKKDTLTPRLCQMVFAGNEQKSQRVDSPIFSNIASKNSTDAIYHFIVKYS